MTLYIVQAKNDLSGLQKELESGDISNLRPFGETLHHGLENSRFDTNTGYAMWVEEDYYVINTQEGPIKIKNLQVWTISGDNAYILTFGMVSDYAPLIDDIINSFKLVQSQTAALNT